MRTFRYTAVKRSGDRIVGEIEASSQDNVRAHLRELGHLPVDVTEVRPKKNAGSQGTSLFSNRPSSAQLTLFTHELAMLLKAGLPLDQSLELLATETDSKRLSRVINHILSQINDGKSLHEAMARQSGVFPPVYINMVRAAEAGGMLESVLERIADARRRVEKQRSKALSALLYPAILVIMAVGAIVIMMVFVVPRFKAMIVQAGTEIPDSARLVIGFSDWLLANGQSLVIALLAVVMFLAVMWRQGAVRQAIENLVLGLPLVGTIMRLNLTVRLCRTLGVLLENGVELPAAMRLVRDVVGIEYAAKTIDLANDALRKGKSFLEPLADSGLFPPALTKMLRVGEETGALTQSLLHLAEMYEEKLDTTLQRTFTILEPVIILLVSTFIAGVIVSILSAVLSVNDLAI